MDYLRRKNDGRWVVRVVVPERLRGIVGQKQFERAVGRDPRTAQKRAYALIAEFQATIARAERQHELQGGDSPARSRRAFSLSEIAHTHYGEGLAVDEGVRNIPGLYTPLPLSRPAHADGLRRVAAGTAPADETEALIGWPRRSCRWRFGLGSTAGRTPILPTVFARSRNRASTPNLTALAFRP